MSDIEYLYGLGKCRHIEKVYNSGRAYCGVWGLDEDLMAKASKQSPESLRAVRLCARCERLCRNDRAAPDEVALIESLLDEDRQ